MKFQRRQSMYNTFWTDQILNKNSLWVTTVIERKLDGRTRKINAQNTVHKISNRRHWNKIIHGTRKNNE